MPTPAYIQLANVTLAATASDVVFASISNNYRHLVLVSNATVLDGERMLLVGINNDNTSGVYWVAATGDGSQILSQQADWVQLYTSYGHYNLTTTRSNITINMMDYASTDKHKTFLVRSSNSSSSVGMLTGRQASNAAINKLRLYPNGSSFAAGSTFTLYGIVG